jgi:hypothetical protein
MIGLGSGSVTGERVLRYEWVWSDGVAIGADSRIRTDDLIITNDLLYQLSYIGIFSSLPRCPRVDTGRESAVFLKAVG